MASGVGTADLRAAAPITRALLDGDAQAGEDCAAAPRGRRSERSMTEFVALVALGVLVLGLGVLAVGCLMTAVGWLVMRGVRHSGSLTPGGRDDEDRPRDE